MRQANGIQEEKMTMEKTFKWGKKLIILNITFMQMLPILEQTTILRAQ